MRTAFLSVIMAATLTLSVQAQQTSKTVTLKVIETSDVHGHFFPWDFMEGRPLRGTLTRANSYINREREKCGDNLLLIDNGDILQGQPCVYWTNYVMPEDENLAARVINYMKYDAETVGNHDIEPGHKVYDKWIREVRCPLLGANIVKEECKNGEANPQSIYTGLQPYSVHVKDGVKICVIGMLTPAIPNWLNKSIWKGIEFEEMVGCARKWVKYIQENEKPDLIHNLQLQITNADISLTAPLAFNSTIKAGDVTMADMFKLYRFENLLFTLRMTGEEVRKHLEYSYDMWTNTMTSPDDHALRLNADSKDDQQRTGFQYYTFNFDSACGIDYEVDLTKPDGEKVKILRMSNGEPFDEKKWYKVAMNSYRANGGGELLTQGAGIPKDSLEARVLFNTDRDQRHFLTEEIRKMGTLDPKPNNNWKFVPEAWAKPALERDRKLLFGNQ